MLEWRAQVADGKLLGPTIFTSGPKLEGIDSIWPGDLEVGSEADVRAALDRLQAMRVDFVKITENTLTAPLYMYGLAEARRRGFTVSAHVPVALTLDQVSEAGLGSIEHMSYLLRGGSPREAELSAAVAAGKMSAGDAVTAMIDSFDEASALATFGRLAARGTAVTPTLNGSPILAYLDQDTHAGDDYLKYIGPGLQATYEGRVTRAGADDAAAVARRHARFELSATLVPLLQRAGVTILAGTDAGFLNSFNYPGIGLHDELALLVKSGLTPQQALVASVVNGPSFLKAADHYGAVAAGRVADLLILDRNPLDDITATRAIRAVVVKGRLLDRAALDGMLADVAARASGRGPGPRRSERARAGVAPDGPLSICPHPSAPVRSHLSAPEKAYSLRMRPILLVAVVTSASGPRPILRVWPSHGSSLSPASWDSSSLPPMAPTSGRSAIRSTATTTPRSPPTAPRSSSRPNATARRICIG